MDTSFKGTEMCLKLATSGIIQILYPVRWIVAYLQQYCPDIKIISHNVLEQEEYCAIY